MNGCVFIEGCFPKMSNPRMFNERRKQFISQKCLKRKTTRKKYANIY